MLDDSEHFNKTFPWAILMLSCLMTFILLSCTDEFGWTMDYSDDEIVKAIYKAEGGTKASRPYGIMLRKCTWDNVGYCELACYQTVQNNRKRYAEWGYKTHETYLEFLASRYAPIGASNDPTGLNKNWLPNLISILERNRNGNKPN